MREVILTEQAQDELDVSHKWWAENRSPQQANDWYIGVVEKLLRLEQDPERDPLAPENEFFPYEVRQPTTASAANQHTGCFTQSDPIPSSFCA